MVLGGNIVIGHSLWRQNHADAQFIPVAICGGSLLHDILVEPGAIVDAQNPSNRAGDRTNRSTDDCPNWTGVSVAYDGAFFCASNRSLCVRIYRQRYRCK